MKIGFRAGKFDDISSDNVALQFKDWTQQLYSIIENRLFMGTFEAIVEYVSEFGEEVVTRLTDEQQEEELIFCSRYNFTLSQVGIQLSLYKEKIEREYDIWFSKKLVEIHRKLIGDQKKEVEDGIRTKGSIGGFTKEDLRARIIYDNEAEYRLWQDYIAEVKKSLKFVENLLNDIDKRAMILMAISRRRRS